MRSAGGCWVVFGDGSVISPPAPVEPSFGQTMGRGNTTMRENMVERVETKAKSQAADVVVVRAVVGGLALLAVAATALMGQRVPNELTLQDAIGLAKANNPTYLSTQNDQASANWQVREAYAQFIPSLRTSVAATWQEAGVQRSGTILFAAQATDWLFSSYNLTLNMTIDGNTIFGVPNARANKRATAARISAAEFNLETLVALQYMTVLRAMDGLDVGQRQLDRARQNLQIVNTRVRTGAAAGTEGRQAEVDLGRAEVVLILARRDVRQARLLLSEQLGVSLEEDVIFLSEFEIFEPDFDMDRLMRMAMDEHPSLQSFRAQESATRAAARQSAVSQYLPSLNFFAQMRGQAQEATNSAFVEQQLVGQALGAMNNCEFSNTLNNGLIGGLPGYSNQDCASLGLVSEEALTSALAANRAFPFNFTEMPMFVGVQISLPIFTGFSRERQVSQANNLAEDAQHTRRAEELRLRTMVTGAFDNLTSAYQVIEAEGRNRTLSEEQLLLQQRRYTLGAADMLLLMDAQTTMTTADQAYLNAIYDFHYNLIALEAAVGQPLR